EGGAEPAAGGHRGQEDGEREGAEDGRRVVGTDHREAEAGRAGSLREGHAQHEQADEQGSRLGPRGEGAAPGRRPVPPRRGAGVREESAGRGGGRARARGRGRGRGAAPATASAAASRCTVTGTPRATMTAPMPAPATVPMLHPAWNLDMIARP